MARHYTETHDWVNTEKEMATIGISFFAEQQLGEVVYVELPKVGANLKTGDQAAVLESTKAATDFYSPVSGQVTEINEAVKKSPSLINESPEEEGWLYRVKLSNPSEVSCLLTLQQYEDLF